jgi:hypothetical protein
MFPDGLADGSLAAVVLVVASLVPKIPNDAFASHDGDDGYRGGGYHGTVYRRPDAHPDRIRRYAIFGDGASLLHAEGPKRLFNAAGLGVLDQCQPCCLATLRARELVR